MKNFKNISVLIVLAIYLFSAVGIPLFTHVCNFSHKKDISLYYFHKMHDPCGCADISHNDDSNKKIDSGKCCDYKFSFLNNSNIREPVFIKFNLKNIIQNLFYNLTKDLFEDSISSQDVIISNYIPPPKLFGKQLVQFIQNIKIPLS